MVSLIIAAFLLGLFGGLRTPIVLPTDTRTVSLRSQFLFNFGRISSYTVLGAVAGQLGSWILANAILLGIGRRVYIGFGIAIVVLGIVMARLLPSPRDLAARWARSVPAFGRVYRFLLTPGDPMGAVLAGVLFGILPWSLAYAMLALATTTADGFEGATLMACFGFGSLPVMVGAALFPDSSGGRPAIWLNRLAMVILFLVSSFYVVRGAGYDYFTEQLYGVSEHAAHEAPVGDVPEPLVNLNAPIPNAVLTDLSGKSHVLTDYRGKTLVLLTVGRKCPCVAAYRERLDALVKEYGGRDVVFLGFDSNANETADDIRAVETDHPFPFPVAMDPEQRVSDMLGAYRMTEAFVIDAQGILRYHGQIDDNIYHPEKVTQPTLKLALDNVLAGKPIGVGCIPAKGCVIVRAKTGEQQ